MVIVHGLAFVNETLSKPRDSEYLAERFLSEGGKSWVHADRLVFFAQEKVVSRPSSGKMAAIERRDHGQSSHLTASKVNGSRMCEVADVSIAPCSKCLRPELFLVGFWTNGWLIERKNASDAPVCEGPRLFESKGGR